MRSIRRATGCSSPPAVSCQRGSARLGGPRPVLRRSLARPAPLFLQLGTPLTPCPYDFCSTSTIAGKKATENSKRKERNPPPPPPSFSSVSVVDSSRSWSPFLLSDGSPCRKFTGSHSFAFNRHYVGSIADHEIKPMYTSTSNSMTVGTGEPLIRAKRSSRIDEKLGGGGGEGENGHVMGALSRRCQVATRRHQQLIGRRSANKRSFSLHPPFFCFFFSLTSASSFIPSSLVERTRFNPTAFLTLSELMR